MNISYDPIMIAKVVSSLLDIKYNLRLMYQHAVNSVNPYNLIQKELKCTGNVLSVGNELYNLNKNVYLVGFGKAVLGMGYQVELMLGNHIKSGILSIPVGQRNMFRQYSLKENTVIEIFEGAVNNIPDSNAERTSKRIVNLIKNLSETDIVLVLISGGGSALMPLPLPPVTLEDKISIIKLLQNAGADIYELNTVRKKLSVLKGGGLLNLAYPARVVAFILSDIVGNPLDLISSGPTINNNDSPDKPKNILEKYSLWDKVPSHVKQVINHPVLPNQKNPSVQNILIGTNRIALEAAFDEAKAQHYDAIILTDVLEGQVSDIYNCYIKLVECVCKSLNDMLPRTEFVKLLDPYRQILKVSDADFSLLTDKIYTNKPIKLCILIGGEPTVRVTGNGKGGRSQQLSLQFSDALNKLYMDHSFMGHFNVGLLCGGTDGIDGPTDAAGAISYNGQMKNAEAQNLDPSNYIKNCDAYTFFSKLSDGEDLLKIGHTGTNVMDVHILLIENIKS